MCYKTIESYSCGDKETATIPCEGFIDNGTCTQHEQAKQDKVTDHDGKCPECLHFDNEMKKLTDDPELGKPVEKSAPKPYDGPKLYFKQCMKWERCGHISHPRETNIERLPEDYEWFEELVKHTLCSKCSLAPPFVIEKMKRDGVYNTPDPWGAMDEEPLPAAGSSSENATAAAPVPKFPKAPEQQPVAVEDIQDLADDDDDEDDMSPQDKARNAGIAAGAPTSYDRSRSSSPAPGKKGKGRIGEPEDAYATRYGAPSDEDDDPQHSDDEDKYERPRGRSAARADSRESSVGTDHHSERDRSFSPGEDHFRAKPAAPTSEAAEAGAEDFVDISDEDRRKYGIPPGHKLTEASFAKWKARSEAAARQSKVDFAKGLADPPKRPGE